MAEFPLAQGFCTWPNSLTEQAPVCCLGQRSDYKGSLQVASFSGAFFGFWPTRWGFVLWGGQLTDQVAWRGGGVKFPSDTQKLDGSKHRKCQMMINEGRCGDWSLYMSIGDYMWGLKSEMETRVALKTHKDLWLDLGVVTRAKCSFHRIIYFIISVFPVLYESPKDAIGSRPDDHSSVIRVTDADVPE